MRKFHPGPTPPGRTLGQHGKEARRRLVGRTIDVVIQRSAKALLETVEQHQHLEIKASRKNAKFYTIGERKKKLSA